jgi:putative ATP-binding cassette transporter
MTWLLNRRVVIIGALAFVTSTITAVLSLYLLFEVSNNISQEQGQTQLHPAFFMMLILLLTIMIGSRYILSKFSSGIVYALRKSLVDKIGSNRFQRIQQLGETRLYNVLLNDVDNVSQTFANLPMLFYNMITMLLALLYLASLSPYLFMFLVAVMVLNVFLSRGYFQVATNIGDSLRSKKDGLIDKYKGLIFGKKELQINAKRNEFLIEQRIMPQLSNLERLQRSNQFVWGVHNSIAVVSMFLLFGFVVKSDGIVSNAVTLQFLVAVMYFSGVFRELVGYIEVYSNGVIAAKRIEAVFEETNAEEAYKAGEVESFTQWTHLHIENLTYQYGEKSDQGFSFGPINLSIKRNEVLFIIGGNGSGKSTFIKLLMGLIASEQGSIKLDSEVIGKNNTERYAQLFSAIHSDMYLFREILDHNGERAERNKVNELFEVFGLTGRVKEDEEGFAVNELSQGQKKRFAMVNTILEDRDIIILDEWAADQDPQFRKAFYRDLIPELKSKGKTLIVISHDDHYFDVADRVIKFDAGSCKELCVKDYLSTESMLKEDVCQ